MNAPLPSVHVLSGPIAVQGCGYTSVFATKNGGRFLTDEIFDIDVRPSAKGPAQIDPGMGVQMASADG